MNKTKSISAAVVIMICLGSVYAWSIFVPELKRNYGFTTAQTQLVFGMIIAVFTSSMIPGRKLIDLIGVRAVGTASGILFCLGYLMAYLSKGSFPMVLAGIGIIGGIATGFGYLLSITIPVLWFPNKKGLITGVVSAGFGSGAIIVSYIADYFLVNGYSALQIFLMLGVCYGVLITIAAQLLQEPPQSHEFHMEKKEKPRKGFTFVWLVIGIFTGTFAGLMVIGNLKPIGMQYNLDEKALVQAIAIFSIANFSGRLFWGWLNDHVKGEVLIPISIVLIGVFSFIIGYFSLNAIQFLLLSFGVGFSFGACFVIYAKETAHVYGTNNMRLIYPFVFLGYGFSGVIGPSLGGYFYDTFKNYKFAAIAALALCLVTALLLQATKRYCRFEPHT